MIVVAALSALMVMVANGAVSAERSKSGADRIVGLRFPDPKETDFLKAVLKAMNLSYTVTATPQGELVEWTPTDAAQELEIRNRVSQFWFISTQCKGMQAPLPAQPARASLSC